MTDVIEKLSRAIILSFKGDPDMYVQPGTPNVYGTPAGEVFAATPGAAVPLWTMYQATARNVLTIAKEVIEQDKIDRLRVEVAPSVITGIDDKTLNDTIGAKS